MKKKSLKLTDLKIQSFVTSLNKEEKKTVAGGGLSDNPACDSEVAACQNSVAQVCTGNLLFCPLTLQFSVCNVCISNVECM